MYQEGEISKDREVKGMGPKQGKRWLSVLLSAAVAFGSIYVPASAAPADTAVTTAGRFTSIKKKPNLSKKSSPVKM